MSDGRSIRPRGGLLVGHLMTVASSNLVKHVKHLPPSWTNLVKYISHLPPSWGTLYELTIRARSRGQLKAASIAVAHAPQDLVESCCTCATAAAVMGDALRQLPHPILLRMRNEICCVGPCRACATASGVYCPVQLVSHGKHLNLVAHGRHLPPSWGTLGGHTDGGCYPRARRFLAPCSTRTIKF